MSLKGNSSKVLSIIFSQETFCFYIISCMVLIPLSEFISELMGSQLAAEQNVCAIYGMIGVFLCTGKMALNPTGRHWSDFFYLTLHAFMFISLIFSCDIARILRPNVTSNEYPAFFLCYYAMLFAGFQVAKNSLRKLVLYVFIGLSLFEGIISALQTVEIKIMPSLWNETTKEVYGLTQNTNLYGALSVLFVGACGWMFIFSSNKIIKVIAGILTVLAVYCSYMTMARLAWVGDAVVVVTYVVSILIMMKRNKGDKKYKSYLISCLIWIGLGVVGVAISFLTNNLTQQHIEHAGYEIEKAEEGNIDRLGSGRGAIWSFCIEALPRHWVTGVGLDNLKQCYIENPKWVPGMYYSNQAHNCYLQVLTTQGVFAFINYMALLIISTVKAVKRVLVNDDEEDRKITWAYLAMFAGFSAAMFFLFRSFTVEPYYCAVIGLMNPRVHKKDN